MRYMLDMNTCIYVIKLKPIEVIRIFSSTSPEDLCVSSITYAELMHGVEKSQAKDRNRVAVIFFCRRWKFCLSMLMQQKNTEKSMPSWSAKGRQSDQWLC